MKNIGTKEQLIIMESLESAIRKLEKSLEQMKQKGVSTMLVEKRLHAVSVGYSVLGNKWEGKPVDYTQEELEFAETVLAGLLPTVRSSYAKSEEGSPQHTLLERRVCALELAVLQVEQVLEERF